MEGRNFDPEIERFLLYEKGVSFLGDALKMVLLLASLQTTHKNRLASPNQDTPIDACIHLHPTVGRLLRSRHVFPAHVQKPPKTPNVWYTQTNIQIIFHVKSTLTYYILNQPVSASNIRIASHHSH